VARGVNEVIRRFIRRLRKNERGAAMVEFALIAILFFTLLFGIIEFGWIFNGYITLEAAAKEGARLAIVGASDADIKKAVTNHAMTFNFVDSEEKEGIDVSIGKRRGDETTVTVTGELPLLVGFFPINNPYPLEVTARMTQER